MNCDSCKSHVATSVPYIVHESSMARMERTIKRLWILLILMAFFLVGTNVAWIAYENQFATVETSITQESETGYNNYIGNDGDIYNGETDGYNQN